MDFEDGNYFCRCGFVHVEFRESESYEKLVTMIDDGHGGFRRCLE